MFFTQDDYKKIQQWLTKNSVKDTEFNEANIPFNGEETITIVQGNQNKKVFLKDLIAQVFNLGVSDFVNITDKYDAPNISLEEAIRLIPSRARKEGQVITFLDMEDHWHIYQFKGVLNQWNVLDTWEDLFDWEKLIIDSILPDEEDLTKSLPDANGNSYLSLKDREYNPNDFSGLGRVILRKNIVEIEDPIYGKVKKNVLYQDMFTQSNTIYEIRYDFDLNGQEITIPEGCVLDFQGGRLSNGQIKFLNSSIVNIGNKCFNNILISEESTVKNNLYTNWFISDEEDVTELLNNLIFVTSKSGVWLVINRGDYTITSTIKLYKSTQIKGESKSQSDVTRASRIIYKGEEWDLSKGNNSKYDIFSFYDYGTSNLAFDVKIENLHIECNSKARYGINFSNISHSQFKNIFFRNVKHGVIYCNSSLNGPFTSYGIYNYFENVRSWSALDGNGACTTQYGIRLQSQTNANYFMNCQFGNVRTGVSLEDNITEDGETWDNTRENANNQNTFYSVSTEGVSSDSMIGFYISSEGSTFINCRSEIRPEDKENSYHIFLDKDKGRTNFTNIIGLVSYGFGQGSYTDYKQYINIPVPDKSITLIGCIHSFLGKYVYPNNFIGNLSLNYLNLNTLKLIENAYNKQSISNTQDKAYSEFTYKTNAFSVIDDEDNKITLKTDNGGGGASIQMYGLESPNSETKVFHSPINIPRNKYKPISLNNLLGLKHYNSLDIVPDDYESNGLFVCKDVLYAVKNTGKYPIAYLAQDINNEFIYDGHFIGERFYILDNNKNIKRPFYWDGTSWLDSNGNRLEDKDNGIFDDKPISPRKGFAYFCTDKQTAEGTTNGIMIYHKGNNVWVDALGRVVE